jgi:hypothetical protein
MSVAEIMQLMPTTDPMDRSILPVINTYDWAIPMIKIGATWRKRLRRFLGDIKFSLNMLNTIKMITSPIVTVIT